MDESALGKVAAAGFLEKNRDLTEGLVEFFNKVQQLSSTSILALTGQEYPVNEIVPDKVIAAVAQRGPEVLGQMLEVLDAQMNDALNHFQVAFDNAAETEDPSVPDPAAADPDPADPVVITAEEEAE